MLPPLDSMRPLRTSEAQKLHQDLSTQINFSLASNHQKAQTNISKIMQEMSRFDPEINKVDMLSSQIQIQMTDIATNVESLKSQIPLLKVKADVNDIRFEPGLTQKVLSKFKEINSDISNIGKRIEINQSKYRGNIEKIEGKIDSINKLLKKIPTADSFNSSDFNLNAKIRIEKIDNFIRNFSMSFLISFLKGNFEFHRPSNNKPKPKSKIKMGNFEEEITQLIDSYNEQFYLLILQKSVEVESKIQQMNSELDFATNGIRISNKFIGALNQKIQNLYDKLVASVNQINDFNVYNEQRIVSVEMGIESIEKVIKYYMPSNIAFDERHLDSIKYQSLQYIKQLKDDWKLFHKNNNFVQSQVFDKISMFDGQIFGIKSLSSRIEAAEKRVEYIVKRIKAWKEEEELKFSLSVTEEENIEKLKELEEKVRIAEERVSKLDGKETPTYNFDEIIESSYKISKVSTPPSNLVNCKEVKPIYLDPTIVLTYDQEFENANFNISEINLNHGESLLKEQRSKSLIDLSKVTFDKKQKMKFFEKKFGSEIAIPRQPKSIEPIIVKPVTQRSSLDLSHNNTKRNSLNGRKRSINDVALLHPLPPPQPTTTNTNPEPAEVKAVDETTISPQNLQDSPHSNKNEEEDPNEKVEEEEEEKIEKKAEEEEEEEIDDSEEEEEKKEILEEEDDDEEEEEESPKEDPKQNVDISHLFKLRRKERHRTNRVYEPYKPIKKGKYHFK